VDAQPHEQRCLSELLQHRCARSNGRHHRWQFLEQSDSIYERTRWHTDNYYVAVDYDNGTAYHHYNRTAYHQHRTTHHHNFCAIDHDNGAFDHINYWCGHDDDVDFYD
jgi:hypothetical protein